VILGRDMSAMDAAMAAFEQDPSYDRFRRLRDAHSDLLVEVVGLPAPFSMGHCAYCSSTDPDIHAGDCPYARIVVAASAVWAIYSEIISTVPPSSSGPSAR
jgi:hypothetical protein